MSLPAKWLLILIIGLVIHLLFELFVLVGTGGQGTYLFPFGDVERNLGGYVLNELLLLAALWIGFAIALLRRGEDE